MRQLLVILMVLVPLAASAAEFASCWVAEEADPWSGQLRQVTRCRITGGDVVDYASDSEVPSVLFPNLGTDLTGQCWYLRSASTSYVILVRYADGSADIGFDTDPTTPGGIFAIGPTIPRCTSEPAATVDPVAEAWEYVMAYLHEPPLPELSPPPGQGVTGMDTFISVAVPPFHAATLAAGSTTIDVEIEVSSVVVDWGDGVTDTFPPSTSILAGYPDGSATHLYEVKSSEDSDLVIAYDWSARWRLSGGAWTPLPVPNTSTAVSYPVAEIVSRLQP